MEWWAKQLMCVWAAAVCLISLSDVSRRPPTVDLFVLNTYCFHQHQPVNKKWQDKMRMNSWRRQSCLSVACSLSLQLDNNNWSSRVWTWVSSLWTGAVSWWNQCLLSLCPRNCPIDGHKCLWLCRLETGDVGQQTLSLSLHSVFSFPGLKPSCGCVSPTLCPWLNKWCPSSTSWPSPTLCSPSCATSSRCDCHLASLSRLVSTRLWLINQTKGRGNDN